MGFSSGNISFRLFCLNRSYDSSAVDAFAQRTAPPIETLAPAAASISGWAGPRFAFDRELTDEVCSIGAYIYVQLFKAERKLPTSLMRAYVQREEYLEKKSSGQQFLSRKQKTEIKERIAAELIKTSPPTLSTIPVVLDLRNKQLVTEAVSDSQIDALMPAVKETLGEVPILLTPEAAALRRRAVNPNDLQPVNFTPDKSLEPPKELTLGQDFLTWLWFTWDTGANVWHLEDGREFGIMLEGPVVFYRDGQGAHEALLRKGTPLNSAEAGTALMQGKKLKRVKFTVAQGEDVYSATLDDEFAFRGAKLPKGEQEDFAGKVEERMLFIEVFTGAIFHLFDKFLDIRTDPRRWPDELRKIQEWMPRIGEVISGTEE